MATVAMYPCAWVSQLSCTCKDCLLCPVRGGKHQACCLEVPALAATDALDWTLDAALGHLNAIDAPAGRPSAVENQPLVSTSAEACE